MPRTFRTIFLINALLLVLVALPRFNRNPILVDVPRADDRYYELMVEHFRGGGDPEAVSNFYFRRPLLPFLAAALPLEAMTALNLVNLGFLLLGLYALMRSLVLLGASRMGQLFGGALFAISFPTFYYATIGYVDPGAVGLLALLVWLILRGQHILVLMLLPAAALAKENTVLILLFYPLWLYGQAELRRKWHLPVLAFIIYGLASGAGRFWAPGDPESFGWMPEIEVLMGNLTRWKAWISGILTLGLPGLGAFLWWRDRNSMTKDFQGWPFFLTGLGAILIWGYAWLAAYADGRFLWSGYPFWIPLAVMWWEFRNRQKEQTQ